MASEVQSVLNPTLSLVHGSQALTTTSVIKTSGKSLPQSDKSAAPGTISQVVVASQQSASATLQTAATSDSKAVQAAKAARATEAVHAAKAAANVSPLPSQVAQLNKYLNDSGRPAQFRASTDNKSVEEINPATGEVVAEYSAVEFPALARSVGISGVAVNSRA